MTNGEDWTPRKRGLFTVVAIGLGLALAVVLGEGTVRLAGYLNPGFRGELERRDPTRVLIVPIGHYGYRQRPNSTYEYPNGTSATANHLGYRGPAVSLSKPSGVTRVLLLGGSVTHGWGVFDHETIDSHMRTILSETAPSRTFEVINLAFDGYDSHQLVERLKWEGLEYAPDIVVVNTGINDVRNARFEKLVDPDPRTVLWMGTTERLKREERRGGPSFWTRLKTRSHLVRALGIARESWRKIREDGTLPRSPGNLQAAEIFEANLRRMVRMALDRGARVILSTPPSSLAVNYNPDATSTRSYWLADAKATQAFRDVLARRMAKVAEDYGDPELVRYVRPTVDPQGIFDDCHLTPDGNRQVGAEFAESVVQLLH